MAALHDQEYQNMIAKLMTVFASLQVQERDEEPMVYYDQQGIYTYILKSINVVGRVNTRCYSNV